MRVLIGIIFGVCSRLGAPTSMTHTTPWLVPAPRAACNPMVNWDVVGNKWNHLTERARAEWSRLAAKT
jgi:hypothetical protein